MHTTTHRQLATTVATLAVALGGLLTACSDREDPAGTPATTTATSNVPSPRPPAPSSPTTGAGGDARAVPVYYIADTGRELRLYREFHRVPVSADPASDALTDLFSGRAGADPDYRSFWPAGAALNGPVRHAGGLITVDLTAESVEFSPSGPQALFTLQQLVYTVQGALGSTDPVQLLVDGSPRPELWGAVSVAGPIERADPYRTRSLVQIDSPAHGDTVARTFSVSGEAAAFEANVPWQLLRGGQVVQSGFTTAEEGQRFSAFRFEVTLDPALGPGEYTLRVVEDDPSGGEGRPPFEDTKLIRVRG